MKAKVSRLLINTIICTFILITPAQAAPTAITFSNLDDLLLSIIMTIQHYTLPIMAIILAFLGVKLITSGDDTASKDLVKGWMLKILIGGAIIFGATFLAQSIKTAVGGI